MDAATQREVLRVARDAVRAAVAGDKLPDVPASAGALAEHRGAFVTLKTRGRLRGCIGQFIADKPLVNVIQDMGVSAATRDPRFTFERITPDEVEEVHIEVSVLGRLEKIDDPLDFDLGIHGIYLKRGYASGCFLPQVATETGWSKEQFLSQCASGKAHLAADAWNDPDTEVFRFTCEIISE